MDKNQIKEIYDSAFEMLMTHDAFSDKLSDLGIDFEYGNKFLGQHMEVLLNQSQSIIVNCLDLDSKQEEAYYDTNGERYHITLYLMQSHTNKDLAIEYDTFFNLLMDVKDKPEVKDLLWDTFVEQDKNARMTLNERFNNCVP